MLIFRTTRCQIRVVNKFSILLIKNHIIKFLIGSTRKFIIRYFDKTKITCNNPYWTNQIIDEVIFNQPNGSYDLISKKKYKRVHITNDEIDNIQ